MSLRARRSLAPLMAAAVLLLFPACRRSSPAVAEVGGSTISLEAWKQRFALKPKGTDPKAVLDELVNWEISWVQAERTGLLKGEGWQVAEPKIRRKAMARAYLESLPGWRAPSEDEVKGFFLSHGEERHVFHVLVRSEEAAVAVRKRLDKGESIEKVAAAVSVDPSVAKNKGDIGWIKRDAVVAEFAKEVFPAKEGSLCGPFRTEYGWHVALVKERRAPSLDQFEQNKGRLMAQAREMSLKPFREEALRPLRDKFPVTVDENVVTLNPSPASAAAGGKKVVGKVCGESVTLGELQMFIKDAMGPGGPDHNLSPATRRRFLEMLGDDLRLEAAAGKAGLTKRPEVQAALWLAQRQAVDQGFAVDYLRKLKPSDSELAAFHQANGQKFRSIGSVKLHLLVAQNPMAAQKAFQDASKGVPWKTLVARYANQESTGNWDPGFLEVEALKKFLPPEAVKALSSNPLDSLVGPVEGPEGVMLFRILERKPGDILPLDQCREAVRMEYLGTQGEKLIQAYLEGEGRKDLKIKLHPEKLQL